ncbi:classical arabinogalactan protein 25-like [Lycium barbarum]|uniref:classical arabinogalactan protein 25-like n=1 Tax=Lycium barbarum TaxID=112863 RepID=UPI00293E970F|nr:classical arabinogalactan protein 25-like [Lycium barbarum]
MEQFLANPPVLVPVASPFSEISPDIAPLLPSSGGVVPPVSSVPIIPSNPSKNPDDMMYPIGPDSAALAPSAFSPISSVVCCVSLTTYLYIAVFLRKAFKSFLLLQLLSECHYVGFVISVFEVSSPVAVLGLNICCISGLKGAIFCVNLLFPFGL